MTVTARALLVTGAVLIGLSQPALAEKVRGTPSCDREKVSHTINGKKYMCTHCSNSICDNTNGKLTNCGTEHNYTDCELATTIKVNPKLPLGGFRFLPKLEVKPTQ